MFVALGLLFFPARVGFRFSPQACELALDAPLALHSLTNYAHIALFGLFFVLTSAQFRVTKRTTFAWASLITLTMGVLVEIAEAVTGKGHCRLRDLIPDAAGVVLGSVIVSLWRQLRPNMVRSAS
jgi:VanZ family protein